MMRLVTDYCPMQRLWLCVAQGLVARAAWFARDCIDALTFVSLNNGPTQGHPEQLLLSLFLFSLSLSQSHSLSLLSRLLHFLFILLLPSPFLSH